MTDPVTNKDTLDPREHVQPGDPADLCGIALRWYVNFDWGAPHSARESNMAVEGFKDGYRAAIAATPDPAKDERTVEGLDPRALLEGTSDAPWSLDEIDPGTWHLLSRRNGFCCDVIGSIHEGEENARLAAAAPQLAQACIAKDEALAFAANLFRKYEQMHLGKGTDEGRDKAERNRDAAEVCDAALTNKGEDR